jgi:hypothetical protein
VPDSPSESDSEQVCIGSHVEGREMRLVLFPPLYGRLTAHLFDVL